MILVEALEHFSSPIETFHFELSCPSNVPPFHLAPLLFFKPSYILEQRGRSVQSKTSPIAYELMQDYANNCRQTMFLLSMLPRPGPLYHPTTASVLSFCFDQKREICARRIKMLYGFCALNYFNSRTAKNAE